MKETKDTKKDKKDEKANQTQVQMGFTVADFPKNPTGRENIRKFFLQLPVVCKDVKILDEDGLITINKKRHTWESVAVRCSLWFDTIENDKKSFSNAVFHKLAEPHVFIMLFNAICVVVRCCMMVFYIS